MQVTITTDTMARPVAVITDDTAVMLRRAALKGWTEISGVNHGYSRYFDATSAEATAMRAIVEAVAASPLVDDRDREIAARGSFYGFVVGASGWDEAAQWWADYDSTRHLHTTGSIVADPRGNGRMQFTG